MSGIYSASRQCTATRLMVKLFTKTAPGGSRAVQHQIHELLAPVACAKESFEYLEEEDRQHA
jgi:hypothetical protein